MWGNSWFSLYQSFQTIFQKPSFEEVRKAMVPSKIFLKKTIIKNAYNLFSLIITNSKISSVNLKLWPSGSIFYSLWSPKIPNFFPWNLVKDFKTHFLLLSLINSRTSNVNFKLLHNGPSFGPFADHGPLNFCNDLQRGYLAHVKHPALFYDNF